jgi:superfamily II DNA or RNA helicase
MSYITKRGIVVLKKDFTEEKLDDIRKSLEIKPQENPDYNFTGDGPTIIKVYQENAKKIYVPRMWGQDYFGKIMDNRVPDGDDISVEMNIELRDYQKIASTICIGHLQDCGGGILSLPCGRGKTIVALYIASQLGKKTLIVVHKDFLIQQWCDHIRERFDGAKVGFIKGNKFEVEGRDFVIATIQSLSMKTFPLNAFDTFGLVILDEAHLVPCRVFSKALQKINSKYMLGLTATPRRKDGLFKILKMYIGDIMYKEKAQKLHEVVVRRYFLTTTDPEYCAELTRFVAGRMIVNRVDMIKNIVTYFPRTEFIASLIKDKLDAGFKKVLVLSERIAHLNDIEELFRERFNEREWTTGFYTGKVKKSLLPEMETKNVIFGTYSMASVGMDIPDLDVLIMASPMSDIEQAVGRVLRKKTDYDKEVIDIIDSFSIFLNQMKKRFEFFKKKKYDVYDYNYSGDKKVTQKDFHKFNVGGGDDSEEEEEEMKVKVVKKSRFGSGSKFGSGNRIRFSSNPFTR